MTGRGIDQILPSAVDPVLHESFVTSASTYVELAESKNGVIPRNVPLDYVWGNAPSVLARFSPDVAVVNLETAVTTSSEWWRGKGIHYRMHPDNVGVLSALGIDVCVLANNHVMDWGRDGLAETVRVLQEAGVRTAGTGLDAVAAAAPAVLDTRGGRVLVFAYGALDSGIPSTWAAGLGTPGVNVLRHFGERDAWQIVDDVRSWRQAGDRVVVSIHWGGNWGYRIQQAHRRFAHHLIDAGAADIIHGHSSHHPKGIEVYRGRLILYGCGDFLNDYEGIGGFDAYRGDLALMYFSEVEPAGILRTLVMHPVRVRRFRLEHASSEDAGWLYDVLRRESALLGSTLEPRRGGRFELRTSG
jgi:poly-gamma-glutamate synthesis protein (capsule biosynthesis protein)